MNSYLSAFARSYPLAQAQDYVKVLYQSAYGCEHILSASALQYLSDELECCAPSQLPLVRAIGGGICQVDLGAYKRLGYSPKPLFDCMMHTRGGNVSLDDALDEFVADVDSGALPVAGARDFVCRYRNAGCPLVRHSEAFRAAYDPHYRVAELRFALLLPLLDAIYKLSGVGGQTLLVAIDGKCGSGKTSAAAALAELTDAAVIHCDDFFLPRQLRTEQRLAQVGGNIHYERLAQVLSEARKGQPFEYERYDCSCGRFVPVSFEPKRIVVVEGSYALHPALRHMYSVKALVRVDEQLRLRRIVQRDGAGAQAFFDKWIPLEERYFAAQDASDCIFISGGEQ